MVKSDLTEVSKELGTLGEKLSDLTAARLGTGLPQEAHKTLMVGLHADIMDRFDDLEDSFTAMHDNTSESSDDKDRIERLEDELHYQQDKIESMRKAERENEISRNHNNYTDSLERTPFAAMRDVWNQEIRGFPRNLRELRALQYHQLSLYLQAVGLPITGDHHTRLFRLADYIGVGHKLFTLTLKPAQAH